MRFFLSFGKNGGRGAGLLAALLLVLGWLCPQAAQATHIRAGDIQAKVDTITGNPNHIYFKLTLYLDPTKPGKQPTATIFFGDGTFSGVDAIQRTTDVISTSNPDIEVSTYLFDHIFPGPNSNGYLVSFVGENRVAGVVNMAGSDKQTFYINSRIVIDPSLGRNHSPVLRAPAIDRAGLGQVFLHNPAAYDADGDSLAFKLRPSQQAATGVAGDAIQAAINNNNTPINKVCDGFVFPDDPAIAPGALQVPYTGVPASTGGRPFLCRTCIRARLPGMPRPKPGITT
ncbi:hypothetical protein [Hymenobacter baengnokdamensis]|uniref:hypothetical protein n=1 Tax=Hymenobacter baengnokdamensis TaxID=2615203 RepID=UPI001245F997|nr:hypothetical protein [Hymenobacter baengnokdamensis]